MNRMGDIDWNLKPLQPVLYLARSDRKTITRLSEAKNIVFNEASEKVFELDFSLPYYIEKNGQMIKNPNIDKIGVMMLIKMELGEREEWFILSTPSTSTDSNGDEHNYKAFSTANQMSGVTIRGYSSEQPRILSDYLDILISSSGETYWTKGYVDGALDAKFRSFEFDSGNLLQAIYELATKFEAIIEFDSVQSKVNMYAKENYGRDEKLVVSHDNYLVQATKTEDALAMVTQMALYGSDGLTINRISPTGANYIEDFSYFLQGFEYDFENNKVLSSSKFMSDELALALVKYSQLVYSKGETFKNYLDEIEAIELELIPKIIEMNDLKTALNVVKNDIDIWLTQNNGVANAELNQKKDELESAIYELSVYIDTRKARIIEIAGATYLTDRFIQYGAEGGLMGLLKEEMLLTNNFSNELLDERANFIIKKDYTNDSIIDDRDLLEEGIKEFERLKEPKIDVSMDMLNILDLIEAQRDWNRLKLGDKIRIVSPEIDLDVYAHINEVTYEFEDGKIKVNITNISRAMSRKDAFLDLMYKANTASNSIQVNKDSWSKGKDADDKVNAILNNVWDATKNKISGGVYSTVEISDRGILSRDPDDPDNTYLVLLNGLLAITQDGGKSWKNAITNMGVIAERLYGQIITGQNLTIGDADGILQFVGNKGIVSDSDGNMVMKLGLVEEATQVGQADKYGILLFRGSTNKVYLTQEDGMVIQKANGDGWENVFSADIDGNFTAKDFSMVNMRIVNAEIAGQGVYLDSQDGIRVDGAGMRQIMINADKGIEMLDIIGNRVFYVDGNGNINVTGINIISGNLAGRDIETVGQSIDDLEVALIDVETYIDGAFKDGVINEAEAKIIANHLETLNNEKADIDAHYTTIYADTNLTGTPKTALFASKTEYDSKHTALITAINNAIADDKVTTAEKTNVDTKFDDYRIALADISKKLEEAKKAITDAVVKPVSDKADQAQTDATSALNKATVVEGSLVTIQDEVDTVKNDIITIEATATDAFANSENAELIAGNAQQTANTAITNAQTSLTNAQNAITKADEAKADALQAKTDATQAVADAGQAITDASGALAEAMKKENAIVKSNTAPTTPVSGQLWVDTTSTPNKLKRWSGSAWVDAFPSTASHVGAESAITKSNTAPTHLSGRLWMDTSVTPNVLKRSTGTAWVNATPTTAGEVGAYTISQVDNALNNKVSTTTYNLDKQGILQSISDNSTAITQNEQEIALKASQQYVNAIDGRLESAESEITIQAGLIASKVSNTDFNTLTGRVSTAESTITQQADLIASKVSTSDFNNLTGRVSTAESTITQQAGLIASKVSTSDFNTLSGRVSTAESSITQQAGEIASKVSNTTFTGELAKKENSITKGTSAPASPVTGQLWVDTNTTPNVLKRWSGSAWVKATPTTASEVGAFSSGEGSALAGRVTTSESSITQLSNEITSKVSTTDFNTLTGRVSSAESTITQQAGLIASKVSSTDFDALTGRVGTAESSITQQAGEIASKVSNTTFSTEMAKKETAIVKSNTAPSSPVSGQLWLDTTLTPNRMKRWSGSAWVNATPTTPTEIGAESNITKATTAPASPTTNQMWLDTSITPNVLKRWSGSAWVKATPTTAGEVGAYSATDGGNLAGRVTTTESSITQLSGEIASKVSSTDFNTLSGRVSTAESTITQQAGLIASKVNTADFNAVEGRLTTAESTITQTANAVTTKLETATFNTEIAKKEDTITKGTTAPSNPIVGQLWLDTSTTLNQLKRWTGSVWAKATPTTATEVGAETNITKSNTAPSSPTSGQLWLDTNFTPNRLKRWSGSAWVNATPTSASEVGAELSIHKGTTAPASPVVGQLWLDTTNVNLNDIKRWDGSVWKKVTPTTSGDIGAEGEIVKQATAPTHAVGKLWMDTSVTPNILKRSTGSAWVNATPTTASEVGAEVEIIKSNTAPSHVVGRLWLDTNTTPNILKRSTGSAWVNATPTNAGEVGAEVAIVKANTAPAHSNGRLWLDTTVTPNVLYRSTGSAWVKATPTTPSEVGAYPASDGTTLSGRVTTAEQDINTIEGEIVNKVSTTDFSLFKKSVGNLVSNPTMTGTSVGWDKTTTSTSATVGVETITDFDSTNPMTALLSTSTIDVHNASDMFNVDPSKMYEFSLWIKNDQAVGLNYVGFFPYPETGSTRDFVTPVPLSTGVAGTLTDNPYFWSGSKTTGWRKIVGFLLPTGTNPASVKNLIPSTGEAGLSTTAYIMPADMRRAQFRFLNWSNGGVSVKTYVLNPRVIETNSDLIIPRFSNLESSITQTANSITSRVAKTTIDTVNKTGIFNDVMNSRFNLASHTGYLVIDTGITLTDQMTNVTIQGYNYSDAGNSLIDLDVGFYARSNSTFSNMGYVNKGSFDPEQVRIAIRNSKVSIILGSPTRVWNYPNILVPKVQVSHGTPVSTFGDGWALSTATAISGFTAVTVVPIGKFRSGVNQVTNSTFNSYEAPTETVLTRNPREWEGNGLNTFDILDPDEKSPYSHILRMYKTGLASDANLAIYSKAIPLDNPASKIYTFSFDVKITGLSTILDASAVVRLMTFADSESTTTASQTITITKKNIVDKGLTDGNWFRFKYQVPAITAGAFLRVSPFLQRNGDVQIRNIMFEEGTDFSDWNPSPSDTTALLYRVAEAEQKITESSIVSTVRNSDFYKNDFSGYVSSTGLSEMGFVDKNGLDTSLKDMKDTLKTLTEDMKTVKTNYTTVSQTAKDITLGVSSGGGINRLINSVGWAGVSAGWTQVLGSGGSVNVRQDENVPVGELGELELLGAGSAWILKDASITQKIRTPLTRDIVLTGGVTQTVSASYTVSAFIKKTATDSPLAFQISTDGTTFTTIGTTLSEAYTWRLFSATFTPTTEVTHIRVISTGATGQTEVTNLLVNDGDTPMQWSNHPTELYSTNARFDRFGMVISNNTTQNFTKITTDEFAGYAPVNGVMSQIFTLNGTTTEVNNLDATEFISVGTIKIQRINSGGRKGLAFLPIEDDDV